MTNKTAFMGRKKRIALIAHDHKKPDLLEWVRFNRETLLKHESCATGTTDKIPEEELSCKDIHLRAKLKY